jgi:bifunctional DNA-binding transcriptional regulator/antitoxin component of YhaV-PrlF toxin-antitoxin module
MVRIPKEVVEQEDIREGEMLELDVRKARRQWFGITPKISDFTHEDGESMRDLCLLQTCGLAWCR